MNVTIGSEDEGPHAYRRNVVYTSLRRSSSQIMNNIKKKFSAAENSIRSRRALRPLNESRSPSPNQVQMRVVAPAHALQGKNVYSTPKAVSKAFAGYEFDRESNLMRTPKSTPTPQLYLKKTNMTARLREFALRRPVKKSPRTGNAAAEIRSAKQLARAKIHEMQSPKRPLLSPRDRHNNLGLKRSISVPLRKGLQRLNF